MLVDAATKSIGQAKAILKSRSGRMSETSLAAVPPYICRLLLGELLIPLIGFVIQLIFYVEDSQLGTNKYGPNPKRS